MADIRETIGARSITCRELHWTEDQKMIIDMCNINREAHWNTQSLDEVVMERYGELKYTESILQEYVVGEGKNIYKAIHYVLDEGRTGLFTFSVGTTGADLDKNILDIDIYFPASKSYKDQFLVILAIVRILEIIPGEYIIRTMTKDEEIADVASVIGKLTSNYHDASYTKINSDTFVVDNKIPVGKLMLGVGEEPHEESYKLINNGSTLKLIISNVLLKKLILEVMNNKCELVTREVFNKKAAALLSLISQEPVHPRVFQKKDSLGILKELVNPRKHESDLYYIEYLDKIAAMFAIYLDEEDLHTYQVFIKTDFPCSLREPSENHLRLVIKGACLRASLLMENIKDRDDKEYSAIIYIPREELPIMEKILENKDFLNGLDTTFDKEQSLLRINSLESHSKPYLKHHLVKNSQNLNGEDIFSFRLSY